MSGKKVLGIVIAFGLVAAGVWLFWQTRRGEEKTAVPQPESSSNSAVTPTPAVALPPAPFLVGDSDSDGLSDKDEIEKYKTDPKNPDTDGDGVPDNSEIEKYKTDPLKADTDGDTHADGIEILKGFNPLGAGRRPTSTKSKP